MSLQGKTVLVTRRREQSAGLVDLLEHRGASVEIVPVIEIVPPTTWAPCDEAVDHLSSYDALLLTSANAARAFLDRGRVRGAAFAGLKAVTVGDVTRTVAAGYGLDAAGSFGDARELARSLLVSPVRGKRYLFPCGDLARDDMPELLRREGAKVDRVEVYRTIDPPPEVMVPARTLLERAPGTVVIFASPSAVRNLCGFLGGQTAALLKDAVVAVIGSTTAEEVRRRGLTPQVIAPRPDAASLVDAIHDYCT